MSSSERIIPKKGLKWHDVSEFKPKRLELSWNLPEHRLDDEFFLHHYSSLTSHLKNLVATIFNTGETPTQGFVWSVGTGNHDGHLERIIGEIGRPNPWDSCPWDDLMECKAKRLCVMRGVLMKVATDQLFSQLLFGADEKQVEILRRQDEEFLQDEGFRRTRLRATTVRMFLDHTDGIPPRFWADVEKIALTTLAVILPVLNWVRRTWPPNEEIPDIKMIYQSLHDSLTYAAWLSVNIRLSSSVLRFTWLQPGERYLPDQVELCAGLHGNSRSDKPGHQSDQELEYAVASPSRFERRKPSLTRLARVMISVVPRVQRYRVVNSGSGEPIGHTVTNLVDPRVVYYYGLQDDTEDNNLFKCTLLEHSVASKPNRRCNLWRLTLSLVRVLLLLLTLIMIRVEIGERWRSISSSGFWKLMSKKQEVKLGEWAFIRPSPLEIPA
ncbi:uncharacterized protein CTRU02_209816 [Colletotrichum truncatum]|uniref:Uncharacterized protein n=1 Tax=Colletotrichum truncatum TaxID=5467 RepID=A0ACC3YTE8_COLTU|nr:uncharacterized protein CTRU02_02387 [Colletotrichum truncatum]KAF6798413.1 hypothetical protein CTRU02_02387 [Colletotrichum truncatum]